MRVTRNFGLGVEDNMHPEQIGKIIAVDHFSRPNPGATSVELSTYFGRLAGFMEHRGTLKCADVDEAKGADTASFADYHTTLIFEDGMRVHIREWDTATITTYE